MDFVTRFAIVVIITILGFFIPPKFLVKHRKILTVIYFIIIGICFLA